MNAQEAELDYVYGDTLPQPGEAVSLMPEIRWVRMGLPFALDHINLWLIEDRAEVDGKMVEGWTVVDCGVARDDTKAHWEQVFASGMDGKPVLRVIVTHGHPDHVGLAHWLCDKWQAPLWITAGEYGFSRMQAAGLPGMGASASGPHFARHGLSGELLEQLKERESYYQKMVPDMPHAYRRIQEGELIRIGDYDWQVITGFGHSTEHAALYCDVLGTLISGDMVLPRISTNVSVFASEPEANPVQQFMDSLARYLALPHDTLVLPSHGKPFCGLHARIGQLTEHHQERLEEVWVACETPKTAVDIVPVMFRRKLDTHQLSFALGEALAHLHKLWYDGRLKRSRVDGVYQFVQAS